MDRETFEKLAKGMTYEEVVEQLGSEGELISAHTAQIEPGFTVGSMTTGLYEWRWPDSEIIRILFSNNQLMDKSSSSESRSEGKSSARGGSTASSSGPSSDTSSTSAPITPETHRPEDLKTHQRVAGATAPGKSTFLERLLSLFRPK